MNTDQQSTDALGAEVYREFSKKGAVGVGKMAPPPVWNEPVDVDGLIVEVGRRNEDVLFHLWFENYPEDFSEQLENIVGDVGLMPHRFEASDTPELLAFWTGEKLIVGSAEKLGTMARPATWRLLKTWAIKAVDYATSDMANDILFGPFMARVRDALR